MENYFYYWYNSKRYVYKLICLDLLCLFEDMLVGVFILKLKIVDILKEIVKVEVYWINLFWYRL